MKAKINISNIFKNILKIMFQYIERFSLGIQTLFNSWFIY